MTGTHLRTGRTTSAGTAPAHDRSIPRWDTWRHDRVIWAAVAMIVAQLAFRAWATYGMWYRFDDLNFMSRMMNEGPGIGTAFREYSGHVRPLSMWLAWLANEVAPYDFRVNATVLLAMQLVADLGLLVLLVRLFGPRWGILPPLALYLFVVISVPISIWWAAGVAQIPLQAVLFWALAAHVTYLRSGRPRDAGVVGLWLVLGFGFHEKTLLVLGAIAILSLSYFARGSLLGRLLWLWRRYWPGIVLYVVLGLAYLALYIRIGLTFDPRRAGSEGMGEVVSNMVVRAWLPAVVGGPLRWGFSGGTFPRPGAVLEVVALVVVGLVIRELARTRRRSLRAWWLLVFFLGCDVVLVLAGRASYVGPLISLDYRFQGELAAVTAIALACAAMPVRGAVETVEVTATSRILGGPTRVAALTAVVSLLGTFSAAQLAWHWQHDAPTEAYFGHLFADLSRAHPPIPIIDATLPPDLMFAPSYPENTLSHLRHDEPHGARFVDVATDHVNMVDHRGNVVPAVVPDTRRGRPGPKPGCGYRVQSRPVTVPLKGPLAFGGWWVRIGYIATGGSPVRVTAGDASYDTTIESGLHALYVRGDGTFDRVRLSGLTEGVSLCTDDVTVGRPVPRTEFSP